jgi:predicted nucleic acid-binding protein
LIVLDASAAVDLLLAQPPAGPISRVLAEHTEAHVPEHFHVEALSALRRLRLGAGLGEHEAQRALRALARLRAVRYPVLPLTNVVWALRDRLSAYDAAYLALAVRLDADLVTTDGGLAAVARQHGRLADVESA